MAAKVKNPDPRLAVSLAEHEENHHAGHGHIEPNWQGPPREALVRGETFPSCKVEGREDHRQHHNRQDDVADEHGEVDATNHADTLIVRVAVRVVVEDVTCEKYHRSRERRNHQALVDLATAAANRGESEHEQGGRGRVEGGIDSGHEAEVSADASAFTNEEKPSEKAYRCGRNRSVENPEAPIALARHWVSLVSGSEVGQGLIHHRENLRDFVVRVRPMRRKPHQSVRSVANDASAAERRRQLG